MNTLQNTAKTQKEFRILLFCDFLSSFGSCFIGTAMAIFKYRELGSLFLASLFPMVGILAQVFAFFINKRFTLKVSFRTIFFLGEIFAGIFALSLFFIVFNIFYLFCNS